MKHIQEITNRYVLPTIEEKTAYGYKRLDPYTKLFEERIIFLGQPIDDTVANDVMAQLLTLESMELKKQYPNQKSRHMQALDCHAQLLRLPQQVDQHKGAGFAVVGDVFAL